MKVWLVKYSHVIQFGAIIIVVFLFTFPNLEPDYGAGLDSSYVWAINHLFSHNYEKLTELVYPFGPLGFLKMPLPVGSNLIVGLISLSILKFLFVTLLLSIFFLNDSGSRLLSVLMTLIISYFADIDLLIIGICTVQIIYFIKNNSYLFFTGAMVIALLGFFIKPSIGINAFSIAFVSVFVNYYFFRKLIPLVKLIILNLFIVFALGFIVFRDISLFFNYIINSINLTLGYSSSLALYPKNNWFLLLITFLTVFSFPLLAKERDPRSVFILLLLPLFIIWKHAMSREDLTHTRIMLYFLFFFWGILTGVTKQKSLMLFFLPSLSILSFYQNMSNLPGYKGYKIEISGINNFHQSMVDYKQYFKNNDSVSAANILQNKVDPEIRSAIDTSTIDFYPWELSYVPANQFNWQPRKTLQSGSFSHWLDEKSSQSFKADIGPDYILFHYVNDPLGGNFGSIDGRYLLNDEPLTIYNILKHYSIEKKCNKFLLLRKVEQNILSEPVPSEKENRKWNEWIELPDFEKDIARLRFFSHLRFLGKIKKLLYKGEIYYIDYQFTDGKVRSYRFNPSNARDGLWINPFVQFSFPDDVNTEAEVIKVRFRNSNSLYISNSFTIQFERIKRGAPWYSLSEPKKQLHQ